MSTLPLVTVYIPTRNRCAQLRQAIQSVLDQSYPAVEVIVVDDASDDDTALMLAKWSSQEPRLRWYGLTGQKGAPAARNLAIREAQGEFVTGLDDDDLFLPERLTAFVSAWPQASHGRKHTFLYAQSRFRRSDGDSVSRRMGQVTLNAMCKGNCIGNQIFAPKALYMAVGGFREELPAWQDLELWLTLLRHGAEGVLVDEVTMVFDDRPRSDRITQLHRQRIESARDALLAQHHDLTPSQKRDLYLQALGSHYGFPLRWQDALAAWQLHPSAATLGRLLSIVWRRIRGR